jgi:hypothetical protein
MTKYFTVIVVCQLPGVGEQFLKYRNVAPSKLKSFWSFAGKLKGLHHVNFYDKNKPKGKNFVKQVRADEILNGTAYVI